MNRKYTIVAALLAMAAVSAGATPNHPRNQMHPASSPADPKNMPPQSPARAPVRRVIIKYKAEMLDKDKDGKVSRVEAASIPELVNAFDKLDRDRDGKLTRRSSTRLPSKSGAKRRMACRYARGRFVAHNVDKRVSPRRPAWQCRRRRITRLRRPKPSS